VSKPPVLQSAFLTAIVLLTAAVDDGGSTLRKNRPYRFWSDFIPILDRFWNKQYDQDGTYFKQDDSNLKNPLILPAIGRQDDFQTG
jgi:hypothetical protein